MLVFALIYPAIMTALLAAVMRKAGFGTTGYVFACGPLFGAALPFALLSLERTDVFEGAGGVSMLGVLAFPLFSLAPLVFLAFVRWPAIGVRA